MKRLTSALILTLALAAAPATRALAEEPEAPAAAVEGQPTAAGEAEHAANAAHAEAQHEGEEAEHHGAPGFDWKTFGLQMLNFGVLVFLLVRFGGKAMSRSMAERHKQLKTDIEAAVRAREAAEARLREQEGRLESLKQEIATLRANIAKSAEADRVRILATAEERAAMLKKETSFTLEQQVRAAEQQLRREVGEQALVLAEQMLRRALQPADQQRMVSAFLQDAAGTTNSARTKEVA